MKSNRRYGLLFLCLTGILSSCLLSQCGVKQPAVSNTKFSSPAADHTRFTDPCSACHESTRLAATKDTITVAHGFGRDCAECHQYLATGPGWAPKAYTHNPTPPACLGCHSLPGEAAKFKATAHGGTTASNGQLRGDCAPCHKYGTSWDVTKK